MHAYIEQLVDLIDPHSQHLHNVTPDEARRRILHGTPQSVREMDGSFALVAREGKTVRMARSLDRPMRYFLAKREDGPALLVADRIDAIRAWLSKEGLVHQFHPSYTRMVPAHYVVEIQLVGCPDPDPVYQRFFNPLPNTQPADVREVGRRYIGCLAEEIRKWLGTLPDSASVGVCFSGGIDSGAVFLTTYHVMQTMGSNLSRLKAFTLDFGDGPDLAQARRFLEPLQLEWFLEPIEADSGTIDLAETIRIVEDYKPLDVEAASMVLALAKGIRQRYPEWTYLLDGDGGDENLKDYPIEENPELTIRSVIHNQMLYQEGWGVGRIKHSLTYSGGLSRSYTRTYAPLKHYQFEGFSPFTKPDVIEIAEGIPFLQLTQYDVNRLYALKGEVVAEGIREVTGLKMPIFPKRRFQHGAIAKPRLRQRLPDQEAHCRRSFLALYS